MRGLRALFVSGALSRALAVVVQRDVDDDSDGELANSALLSTERGQWSAGFSRNCLDKVSGTVDEEPQPPRRHQGRKDMWNVIPPPWPPPDMEVKLAMMMFVKNSVFNADVWVDWLRQAKDDNVPFELVIHTKEDYAATMDERLKEHVFPEHVETDKCNLWKAQWAVIDSLNSTGDISHYIMLSENAVPVKSLQKIYKALKKEPLSRLCADDNFAHPRAETWWMLRRDDVAWFSQWRDGLHDQHGRGCIDENLWYSALKERLRLFPEEGQILKECWMYVNWRLAYKGGCKDWKRVAEAVSTPLLDSMDHKNAGPEHPVVWLNVTGPAFRELVASPYWFARKFTDGAIPRSSAKALLGQYAVSKE